MPEETDTLRQVAEIGDALTATGATVDVLPVDLDLSPLAELALKRPDAVFNLVEALSGKDRLIHLVPAVLESFGVPVTGCSAQALFATSNKPRSKQLMRQAGIPTPDWILPGESAHDGTWIVKSVWEHASVGLDSGSVVGAEKVATTLDERAAQFGGDWFAEHFVDGREFNVSLLGGPRHRHEPEVLPIAEMNFVGFPAGVPQIVDYAAKWDENSDAYRNTVRGFELPEDDEALLADIAGIARACWQCFGIEGYARVDFRIDESGRPWVLEVNCNPCLTSDAGFMAAASRGGLSQQQVVMRLLAAGGAHRQPSAVEAVA